MPEETLKIGDERRRGGAGLLVTIDDITFEGGVAIYLCSWMADGELNRDLVSADELK